MRTIPLLHAFAAAVLGGFFLLPACGTTVINETSGGASGTGGAAGGPSTGGTTTTGPSTGGTTTTGPGTGAGPFDAGPFDAPWIEGGPFDSGPFDSGPFDSGPFDSGPPDGPVCPGNGDACTDCLSAACPSTYCACYSNLDCGEIFQCYGSCMGGNMGCQQMCDLAHPDGISPAALLSSCAGSLCPAECPGNMPLSNCDQCLFTYCGVQMNACVANPECTAYLTCTNPCNGSPTCIAGCQAAHPTGVVDADKVEACAAVYCNTPSTCG